MSSASESFHDMMRLIDQADGQACAEVFHRYAQQLIGVARARMSRQIRAKEDAEDIVQSVFKSFFAAHTPGKYSYENWDSLWGMLVVITLRKCGKRADTFHAACRDVRREHAPQETESGFGWQAMAREPSPDEVVMLQETVERVMRDLSERDREILMLKLQGHTTSEISERVDRTVRTVERALEQIRSRLELWRAQGA